MIRRESAGDIIFNFFNNSFFFIFTAICVFPFYYLFINTISDNGLVQKGLINFFPKGIHLSNYIKLAQVSDLTRAFGISVSRTILGTFLTVLASGFVGYLMTKKEMWKRKFGIGL